MSAIYRLRLVLKV